MEGIHIANMLTSQVKAASRGQLEPGEEIHMHKSEQPEQHWTMYVCGLLAVLYAIDATENNVCLGYGPWHSDIVMMRGA